MTLVCQPDSVERFRLKTKRAPLRSRFSAIDAPLIIAGSVVGAVFPRPGLFLGAIVGGLVGIWMGAVVAVRLGLVAAGMRRRTAIGSAIGFVAAGAIAVQNLQTPVIPALCGLLIGTGAVVGSRAGASNSQPELR